MLILAINTKMKILLLMFERQLIMTEFTVEELDFLFYVLTKFKIEYHTIKYPNVFYQNIENLQNKIFLIKEFEKKC